MDGEAVYAHFALQRLRIRPREFFEMDRKEKAFVIASIKLRLEDEKREARKARKKRR